MLHAWGLLVAVSTCTLGIIDIISLERFQKTGGFTTMNFMI